MHTLTRCASAALALATFAAVLPSASGQTLYRFGTGPGGAQTVVSLMSRDAHSFLVRVMSGPGAGLQYWSMPSLAANQPGIGVSWTTFGAAVAPGIASGTQFYGTNTVTATSFSVAYSGLSGAPTSLAGQGGGVLLARSSFVDGNSAPVATFAAVGNARATGFDRPFIYRPGSASAPFAYLSMPAGYANATVSRISDDGRFSFGLASDGVSARLLVWDGTTINTNVPFPSGLSISDVNADGSVALGVRNNVPQLIARDGTLTALGAVPGGGTINPSGLSGDGLIAIGNAAFSATGAWVWTAATGYRSATDVFSALLPAGATVTRMDFVSQDGRTFAGQLSTSLGLEAFTITNFTIPTPGAAVLLGMAGLAGTRRRRR
jgi:hypothetical protein